jgi:hypothetical protein
MSIPTNNEDGTVTRGSEEPVKETEHSEHVDIYREWHGDIGDKQTGQTNTAYQTPTNTVRYRIVC